MIVALPLVDAAEAAVLGSGIVGAAILIESLVSIARTARRARTTQR